ncbi:hypothetical protein MNBD_GAMMA08-1378 [hydrothermal vent metagenome]|uniref:Inner membrane protein YgaP-like transmembrane domain-containing protein n=1 Tax=hydrothermal vent metagenome TaxID=652676 RepID=A0A3B0XTI1_9ZZZZ
MLSKVLPKPNLHIVDRIVRIMFGIFLIYIGYIDETMIKNDTISMLIAAFGVGNIAVALACHCPLYSAIGLSTCKQKDETTEEPSA